MPTDEPTSALQSDMEYEYLDNRVTSSDQIRAELERINKTLKLSMIQKHEPYERLPYQYMPMPDIDHRPPLFVYGLALGSNLKEIREYILRPDTPIPPETIRTDRTSLLISFVGHLRELFNLEDAAIHWFLADCDDRLVFQLMTNYNRYGFAEEKVAKIILTCERLFQRPPMWYLWPFARKLKEDYCIPESTYFD